MNTAIAPRPLWRTIWEFPLVAMAVALGLLFAGLGIASWALAQFPAGLEPHLEMSLRALVAVTTALVIYKLAIRHFGARRRDDLPLAGAFGDTALGLGVGAALMTTVVGIATVVGAYRIVGPGGWSDFLEIVLSTGVVAGLIEELVLRGIVFRWLEELGGSLAALVVSSALFGLLHAQNPNASLFSSLAIALEAGILLGGAYMLTRSLWLAVGLHAGWNVAQGFIWGVPVSGFQFEGLVAGQLYGPAWKSGGAFGLEASVIALVVATAAGLWLVWQARKQGHWMAPMWARKD